MNDYISSTEEIITNFEPKLPTKKTITAIELSTNPLVIDMVI
jgi:hypothetical protein